MSLRIRRGPNSLRTNYKFDPGEIVWVTDSKKLYVGDGNKDGGWNILANSVDGEHGIEWHESTQTLRFNGSGVGIPTVSADSSPSLGGDLDIGAFNISGTGSISVNSISAVSLGQNLNATAFNITNIGNLSATTITANNLGGNLYADGKNITSVGNFSATTVTATNLGGNLNAGSFNITNIGSLGATTLTATNLGGNLNTGSYNLTGTGSISADTISVTNLGRNLSLNSYYISGTGGINVTGTVTASGGLYSAAGIFADKINTSDANISAFSIYTKANNDLELNYFNGNRLSKTPILPGDNLGQLTFKSWNGTNFDSISVGINAATEGTATITDQYPQSIMRFFVGAGGNNVNIATFNFRGVFSVPLSQTTVYSVAGTALPSAATVGVGARAFVSDATATTFASTYAGSGSNNVPVYSDGSVWRIG
jgi:hypothetical protein